MPEVRVDTTKTPIKELFPEERKNAQKVAVKIWDLCKILIEGKYDCEISPRDPNYALIIIGGKKFIDGWLAEQDELDEPESMFPNHGFGLPSFVVQRYTRPIPREAGSKEDNSTSTERFFIYYPQCVVIETRKAIKGKNKVRGVTEIHEANEEELKGLLKTMKDRYDESNPT